MNDTPKRITIPMTLEEFKALCAIADDEMRDIRDHARYILREEFIRQGKLPARRQADNTAPELALEETCEPA